MLNRQIEVVANLLLCCNQVEQLIGDAVRVSIEQTQPGQILDFYQFTQELRQLWPALFFCTESGYILGNQVDFLDAARGQALDFCNDGVDGARSQCPANTGNDTIGTVVSATLGDFNVGGIKR